MAAILMCAEDRARSLAVYLRHAADRDFCIGTYDCLIFPADWIVIARGVDPAAPWRGAIHDVASARGLLRNAGGIRGHAARSLAAIGLSETDDPQLGDVGLVRAPVAWRGRVVRRLVGAICAGDKWALFTPDAGIVVSGPPVVQPVLVWGV
jgi:hypothetical protein